MHLSELALVALAVVAGLSAILTVAWLVWRSSGNAGWIDTSWSFGVGVVAFVAALVPLHGDWPHGRQIAIAAVAAGWSVRLGLHIGGRSRRAGDDPRYRELVQEWGPDAPRRMFWFLQSQAVVGAILALSVALTAHNNNPAWRFQDLLGLLVIVIAVIGEAVADRQLRSFKAAAAGTQSICDRGLWAWSRHPNYFFEWLFWTGFPIVAIDFAGYNPFGWLALAAPVSMYWVLVHVSGIPLLEAHMLRTRGAAFSDYQRRTSAFFPRPPK